MLSLFRRDPDQGWHYREAWFDSAAGELVVHHGKVGTNGRITAERTSAEDVDGLLAGFAEQCAADGYREPAAEDLTPLEVVCPIKGAEPLAVERRNAEIVHEALLPTLAWRGLGALSEPVVEQHDGGREFVMRFATVHRSKAQRAVADAVKSTDVPLSKATVRRGVG